MSSPQIKSNDGSARTPSLLRLWQRASAWPAGARIFSSVVGFRVPYAATISPRVESVGFGHARVLLADRRRVRNHLKSIHAVALAGLGELTANMALMSMQPADGRWIVRDMRVSYVKKGSGRDHGIVRRRACGLGNGSRSDR